MCIRRSWTERATARRRPRSLHNKGHVRDESLPSGLQSNANRKKNAKHRNSTGLTACLMCLPSISNRSSRSTTACFQGPLPLPARFTPWVPDGLPEGKRPSLSHSHQPDRVLNERESEARNTELRFMRRRDVISLVQKADTFMHLRRALSSRQSV